MNCEGFDPLVTPYVDGQLREPERDEIDRHLSKCPPCRARADAERAVRALMQSHRVALQACRVPAALQTKCSQMARAERRSSTLRASSALESGAGVPLVRRLVPLALAASLVLLVSGAFVYQLTASSSQVMVAELTADHVKCFALSGVLSNYDSPAAIERAMLSGFAWSVRLPPNPGTEGLELVGARQCLYGEGRIAHIMYRHHGEPVSLFMLPKSARAEQTLEVMGHEAAVWCARDRTFVLITREPRDEVRRLASFVQTSLTEP